MSLLKYGPIKAIIALFSIIALYPASITATTAVKEDNVRIQNEHMSYLENEYYGDSYVPCDENAITSFDLEEALADGIKYNEVSFIGTHNSYQTAGTEEYQKLYEALDIMTFGAVDDDIAQFSSDYLTDQLELGIRSIELDVETCVKDGKTSFVVCHSTINDANSNCYDFEKALEEIKMWSDNNPNHLPITVIIEPKKLVPAVNGMQDFTLKNANAFDEVLSEKLGSILLTPAEMLGSYDSFKTMRENDGWLPLSDTLGKVIVLLHDTTVSSKYIAQDESIRTQAMFPMVRYSQRNASYASFMIANKVSEAVRYKDLAVNDNLILRTRADAYTSFSDSKYQDVISSGAQIISTDYPLKKDSSYADHEFTFDGGYTVTYSAAY